MDVLIERCAGMTSARSTSKPACVLRAVAAGAPSEVRTFATTTGGVLAPRDWLTGAEVSVVGMESTGELLCR